MDINTLDVFKAIIVIICMFQGFVGGPSGGAVSPLDTALGILEVMLESRKLRCSGQVVCFLP